MLDVGTGSGVLALRAARHAERVVGVEQTARAAAFARFNRWLNGAGKVAIVRGDLASAFAPGLGSALVAVRSNAEA